MKVCYGGTWECSLYELGNSDRTVIILLHPACEREVVVWRKICHQQVPGEDFDLCQSWRVISGHLPPKHDNRNPFLR